MKLANSSLRKFNAVMVSSGRAPQTPVGFHALISTGIGGAVPILAHANKAAGLIILIALWVGFQVFMHIRARRARGVFVDQEVELYYMSGAAGFLIGLLVISTLCVVL